MGIVIDGKTKKDNVKEKEKKCVREREGATVHFFFSFLLCNVLLTLHIWEEHCKPHSGCASIILLILRHKSVRFFKTTVSRPVRLE